MFNLFGRKTLEEFKKEAEDTYAVPDVAPVSAPTKHKEYYRVGRTDNGYTTLTMLSDDGYGGTMTLTMNQEACEQMIRMLEATFSDTAKSNDHA